MDTEKEKDITESKGIKFLKTFGSIILYILAFPLVMIIGIILGICGATFLFIYIIGELLTWPISELFLHMQARKQKKEQASQNNIIEISNTDDVILGEAKNE